MKKRKNKEINQNCRDYVCKEGGGGIENFRGKNIRKAHQEKKYKVCETKKKSQ